MKLYYVEGSANCRKVLATIRHLGLDVEIKYLDFFDGDMTRPEFLQHTVTGRVPVLVDGDFSLWESNAIMQYLADKVPGNLLFPVNARRRADVVRWQCWELAHYNQALGTLVFESVFKPGFGMGETDQAAVKQAATSLIEHAGVLDKYMVDKKYVTGDQITIADYSVLCLEAFKEDIPFDWSGFEHLNAYYDRIRSEPHWRSTAPASIEALGRVPESA